MHPRNAHARVPCIGIVARCPLRLSMTDTRDGTGWAGGPRPAACGKGGQ
eukprot:gene20025-22370_t